jgi:hypothetical protein
MNHETRIPDGWVEVARRWPLPGEHFVPIEPPFDSYYYRHGPAVYDPDNVEHGEGICNPEDHIIVVPK